MRRPIAAVTLAAMAAVSAAQTQPLPPLTLGDTGLHPAWRVVGFPQAHKNIPPTRFDSGVVDGVAGVRVETDRSYGTLVHPPVGPTGRTLTWRWRLDTPLAGGSARPDILTRAGDDAALKVCAMFDHPLEAVPFFERQALRIARSVSGETLPAATVCYVWDSTYPAQTQAANPYTRRVRFITLQGASAPLARWVTESRDLSADFARLFADELPPGAEVPRVTRVLVGADSDNTGSHSTGWVADLRWAP
jgi:hypothetical protein